ncbi:MAG: hypothetical protein K0R10_2881 [Alphaproteobacteria bacterium]|jgi:hypothetical protein|nr:hypothetical protein [Alphaproteobacteria bacterium]
MNEGLVYIFAAIKGFWDEFKEGGYRRRMVIVFTLLIAAVVAMIPLTVNSFIFYPYSISAPMVGQVTGDYDSTGNSLVLYESPNGESREYRAYSKLPKEKPVEICESAFGRPFLCNELSERQDKFLKNFVCLLLSLGYCLWFFKWELG